MYAATGGPNVKWGGNDFKWRGREPLPPACDTPGPSADLNLMELSPTPDRAQVNTLSPAPQVLKMSFAPTPATLGYKSLATLVTLSFMNTARELVL